MIAAVCSSLAVAVLLARPTRSSSRTPGPSACSESGSPRLSRRARTVLLSGLVIAAALSLGVLPTVAIAVGVAAWPRCRALLVARAAQWSIDVALPDAIEMLVLVIHAGLTPHQAVRLLEERAPAPTRPGFTEVQRRVDRGTPLADALDALSEVLGPAATVIADTLVMSERYGTPIGQALEQLAIDVREQRQRHAEAEARKLPVRMSFPLVACTLPSFVLIAIVPAVLAALSSLDATGF